MCARKQDVYIPQASHEIVSLLGEQTQTCYRRSICFEIINSIWSHASLARAMPTLWVSQAKNLYVRGNAAKHFNPTINARQNMVSAVSDSIDQ